MKLRTPELQTQVTKQWTERRRRRRRGQCQRANDQSPGAGLAARWRTLVAGFTGADPRVQQGPNRTQANNANWPAQERECFRVDPRVQDFVVAAMAVMPK